MRVQRVVLEHHRYIAVFRRDIVYILVAYVKLALGYLLKSRYHTEGRRFSASGGTDEDKKLLVLYLKVEV